MFKKIIIGILIITVLGSGGAALAYNTSQRVDESQLVYLEPLANSRGRGQQGQQADQTIIANPQIAAQGMAGEPWQMKGTITALDDYGFDLQVENGDRVYIELGPPDFWQSQGVKLTTGQQFSVTGSINEGMIHVAQVQTAEGQVLTVRSENGQSLWSGGGIVLFQSAILVSTTP